MTGAMAGVCSALRISRKVRTVAFGGGALACAVFVTATVFKLTLRINHRPLKGGASIAIIALCVMGLVQYLVHTVIGATVSCTQSQRVDLAHVEPQLPVDVDQLFRGRGRAPVSSSAASARRASGRSSSAFPIIVIVYFSYDRYMREVKASARHAEEAERARAELEHQRAEQAERHVQELNNYIAEQERISRVLEETKEHFRHAAFHDSLTGLPNRAMFTELLKAEIESSSRQRRSHVRRALPRSRSFQKHQRQPGPHTWRLAARGVCRATRTDPASRSTRSRASVVMSSRSC